MSGKGSKPRPFSVDQQKFSENWDRAFGSKNFREMQQDLTELNSDGNRDRGRYGEDLQYESGNPLERPFEMWSHYCEKERSSMRIMMGEACNWCGQYQNGKTD